MHINIDVRDRHNNELSIGDRIRVYDWGRSRAVIGEAVIVFDDCEGRVSCNPCLVDDAYDFFTKALPLSEKIETNPDISEDV